MNLSSVLHSKPANCTWRATKSTFQNTPLVSWRWRSSSSFLSFCPISARKAQTSASTSPSRQIENEKNSAPSFTSIEPTPSSSPANISKAVSAAAGNDKDIEFNLPWAVALAGAAFESYADVAVQGLVQKCSRGVEITFTNQEFLRDKMAGLLRISVEEISLKPILSSEQEGQEEHGEEHKKKEKDKEKDLSSFCCQLSIGDSYLELQPQISLENKNSNGAENFSEEHSSSSGYLFVRNLEKDRLSIKVVDDKEEEDDAGAASLIATEFVDAVRRKKKENQISGLKSDAQATTTSKELEITLDLQDKELHTVGSVRLKLDYKPFSDVFVAAEASQGKLNLLGSPGPALMSDAWRGLTSQVLEASSAAFDPVAFIENHDTDTQVWIFINKSLKQLVVSFRGTVQDSWRDLLTDISMTPISLETRHMKESPRQAHLAKLSAEPGTIHKVMHTVAHAKKEIELRKQAAKKAAENAALASASLDGQGEGGDAESDAKKSQEEAEKEAEGLVSSAVGAVKTTATDIQEFLTRLKYLIDRGNIEGPGTSLPPSGSSSGEAGSGGGIWVHSGFLSAYDSVRGAVLGLIDTALANSSSSFQENKVTSTIDGGANGDDFLNKNHKIDEDKDIEKDEKDSWTVLFTGHSLGGALATLAAFDLSHRSKSWNNKPEKIAMYNFGSPRVGNKAFATEFNRAVPHAWRLVNRNDAVVTVPRLVGYCHVGHAVIVGLDPETHNKRLEVQLHSSEAPFEGMAVVDEVLPAVGAAITHAVTRAMPAVIKGVGREIAAAVSTDTDDEEEILKSTGESSISNTEINDNDEDSSTAESTEEKEKRGAKLTSEQLAEYWEQEKEAWSALLHGTAISEHMEEFYFKGIEEAVDDWRQQRLGQVLMKENQHVLKHNSKNGNGNGDGAGLVH